MAVVYYESMLITLKNTCLSLVVITSISYPSADHIYLELVQFTNTLLHTSLVFSTLGFSEAATQYITYQLIPVGRARQLDHILER